MEDRDVKDVVSRVLGPAEREVGCDACFDELDRYVELEAAGADADAAVPGLRAHLAGLVCFDDRPKGRVADAVSR